MGAACTIHGAVWKMVSGTRYGPGTQAWAGFDSAPSRAQTGAVRRHGQGVSGTSSATVGKRHAQRRHVGTQRVVRHQVIAELIALVHHLHPGHRDAGLARRAGIFHLLLRPPACCSPPPAHRHSARCSPSADGPASAPAQSPRSRPSRWGWAPWSALLRVEPFRHCVQALLDVLPARHIVLQ